MVVDKKKIGKNEIWGELNTLLKRMYVAKINKKIFAILVLRLLAIWIEGRKWKGNN